MKIKSKNWVKYILGFSFCLLVRFVPFRAPNIEPILATQMPIAKFFGKFPAFFFGFTSVVLYDLLINSIGIWTLFTATTYGIIGLGASYYLKNKSNSTKSYIKFAIIGTLFYDAITGLVIGPVFFNQPFVNAFLGQIPFTMMHLLGNIIFTLTMSSVLFNFFKEKSKFEKISLLKVLNYKII